MKGGGGWQAYSLRLIAGGCKVKRQLLTISVHYNHYVLLSTNILFAGEV